MGRKNVGFLDKKFCKNEKSIWKIVQILWISFFMSTSDILIIPLKIYVTFTKTLNLKVNFLSKKLEAVSEFFKCSNQEVLCKRVIFKLVFLTTSAVHRFCRTKPLLVLQNSLQNCSCIIRAIHETASPKIFERFLDKYQ